MRKIIIAATAVTLGLVSMTAGAASCKYKADRAAELDLEDARTVEIYALAGELRIRGEEGTGSVRAAGDVCVSKEGMLEETRITVRRTGDRVQVLAEMPDISGETGDRWRNQYAVMDLDIRLPAGVDVIVQDSSGDLKVANVASAQVSDSSGGIELIDIPGAIVVPRDSSGDIFMERVGDVTIQIDSSGEIEIRDAASVTIANDTSGDIVIREVRGSVLIGNDTSGRISARDVGGDLVVENDTSGDIRYERIAGKVSLPEDRQGD